MLILNKEIAEFFLPDIIKFIQLNFYGFILTKKYFLKGRIE
jgi:hypothetical protein